MNKTVGKNFIKTIRKVLASGQRMSPDQLDRAYQKHEEKIRDKGLSAIIPTGQACAYPSGHPLAKRG